MRDFYDVVFFSTKEGYNLDRLNQDNREQYTRFVMDALKVDNTDKFRELYLELHPTDQVELFILLNESQRKRIYAFLSPEEFAEIFQGLEIDDQKELITELDRRYAVDVFNHMYADDVADFLGELSDANAEQFLSRMDHEDAQDVKDLLAYPDESAGALMTTEFISVSIKDTMSDVMALLRKEAPDAETIYYLYVTDEEQKLVGVVSLRDLIVSSEDEVVEDVMSTRLVSVSVLDDQEDVADLIKKYDFMAIPVVNKEKLVGIITVDDIMDVVDDEATEDIGEISAVRGAGDLDISSFGAARLRAPWIIVLMFLGLITANVIGQFEDTLAQFVLIAAFIPLIMGSAGNTGTQSLAVVVRGLALGNIERSSITRLLRRELGTGILLGVVCATVLSLLITIIYGEMLLGVIVGVSLLVSLSVATVIGASVPLIINKLKIDPAVASGPFITTLNDIISLLIYFSIATSMMSYLI